MLPLFGALCNLCYPLQSLWNRQLLSQRVEKGARVMAFFFSSSFLVLATLQQQQQQQQPDSTSLMTTIDYSADPLSDDGARAEPWADDFLDEFSDSDSDSCDEDEQEKEEDVVMDVDDPAG